MYSLTVSILFALAPSLTSLFAQENGDSSHQVKQDMERVSIKELDAFHKLLHPLVHDAYPSNDYTSIRKALPDLIVAAKRITSAKLPKALLSKQKQFRRDSKKLLNQLGEMDAKKLTDEQLGKRFMKMHDTFEGIMELVQ